MDKLSVKYRELTYPSTSRSLSSWVCDPHTWIEAIEQVDQYNYLGIELDPKLSYKNHVIKIATKCKQVIGALCRTACASGSWKKSFQSSIRQQLNRLWPMPWRHGTHLFLTYTSIKFSRNIYIIINYMKWVFFNHSESFSCLSMKYYLTFDNFLYKKQLNQGFKNPPKSSLIILFFQVWSSQII